MGAGVCDEYAPPVEVGAIKHDLVVYFTGRHHAWGHIPAPGSPASKRSYRYAEFIETSRAGGVKWFVYRVSDERTS